MESICDGRHFAWAKVVPWTLPITSVSVGFLMLISDQSSDANEVGGCGMSCHKAEITCRRVLPGPSPLAYILRLELEPANFQAPMSH